MVEKGSDHSSDKSPSTPEQGVQRSYSSQSGRSGGKNLAQVHRRPAPAILPFVPQIKTNTLIAVQKSGQEYTVGS
ncbi:UNVERIFIED_CONTAM: hypothetical protein FKN15_067498 [Acipenser sinensis]